MTNRETLLQYIKHGGEKFICSPQIGAGAGFDARLSGKTWLGEATLDDTRKVCEMFDMVPLYNMGIGDPMKLIPDVSVTGTVTWSENQTRKTTLNILRTPRGELQQKIIEEEYKGGCPVEYYVRDEEDLDIVEYIFDSWLEMKDFSAITEFVKENRRILGENEAMDIQWPMQPYELFCFPSTADTAILATICEERFVKLMDKMLEIDERFLKATAKGGADFVFLGGPGSEMISPRYYEKFLVPYSRQVTQMAHKEGLLVYSHICSPIEPMLSMGYYNEMGIDLFETLSEAPVGNVKSLEDAFSKLAPDICTRGNIGLDALLYETPEQIYERSLKILETAKRMGRKHILAASDYLFYDCKTENVEAMCAAVRDFNGK